MRDYDTPDPLAVFDIDRLLADSGFRDDVAAALVQPPSGPRIAGAVLHRLGGGAALHRRRHRRQHRLFRPQLPRRRDRRTVRRRGSLLGPSEDASLAFAYGIVTVALGFRMFRHEGKVTGLAAYGEPVVFDRLVSQFSVTDDGVIRSRWTGFAAMQAGINAMLNGVSREDAAASIQLLIETLVPEALGRILRHHPHRRLGLSGGLFANVRLNRVLAETLPIDEIFIVPPMGDEGLSLGAGLGFLLARDGLLRWLDRRHRLRDLYWGRDYDGEIDMALRHLPGVRLDDGMPTASAARRLAEQQIGAIYTGRMEFGHAPWAPARSWPTHRTATPMTN